MMASGAASKTGSSMGKTKLPPITSGGSAALSTTGKAGGPSMGSLQLVGAGMSQQHHPIPRASQEPSHEFQKAHPDQSARRGGAPGSLSRKIAVQKRQSETNFQSKGSNILRPQQRQRTLSPSGEEQKASIDTGRLRVPYSNATLNPISSTRGLSLQRMQTTVAQIAQTGEATVNLSRTAGRLPKQQRHHQLNNHQLLGQSHGHQSLQQVLGTLQGASMLGGAQERADNSSVRQSLQGNVPESLRSQLGAKHFWRGSQASANPSLAHSQSNIQNLNRSLTRRVPNQNLPSLNLQHQPRSSQLHQQSVRTTQNSVTLQQSLACNSFNRQSSAQDLVDFTGSFRFVPPNYQQRNVHQRQPHPQQSLGASLTSQVLASQSSNFQSKAKQSTSKKQPQSSPQPANEESQRKIQMAELQVNQNKIANSNNEEADLTQASVNAHNNVLAVSSTSHGNDRQIQADGSASARNREQPKTTMREMLMAAAASVGSQGLCKRQKSQAESKKKLPARSRVYTEVNEEIKVSSLIFGGNDQNLISKLPSTRENDEVEQAEHAATEQPLLDKHDTISEKADRPHTNEIGCGPDDQTPSKSDRHAEILEEVKKEIESIDKATREIDQKVQSLCKQRVDNLEAKMEDATTMQQDDEIEREIDQEQVDYILNQDRDTDGNLKEVVTVPGQRPQEILDATINKIKQEAPTRQRVIADSNFQDDPESNEINTVIFEEESLQQACEIQTDIERKVDQILKAIKNDEEEKESGEEQIITTINNEGDSLEESKKCSHGDPESASSERDKISSSPSTSTNCAQLNQKTHVPLSLLTSTGCGPSDEKAQTNAVSNAQKKKSKQPKTTQPEDQNSHITKFSNSLIFNAIERVTKAGSELVVRRPDPTSAVQQLNQDRVLYDFDSEAGLENCRKYLESIENLFALSFLKRASRAYRADFTAAYRVLYDNPVASPLNYLVEILDSAQESFPYLWVNGKKYEFSELVLQQGNMLYQTFRDLKQAINTLHLSVVTARATKTEEFCSLSVDDLQKLRSKVEQLLEQFDQDWSIYEKGYVTELMNIEADARRFVIEAIKLCEDMSSFETEQRRKGKVFFTQMDEYNRLRNKFLRQISQINSVANYIGQGRDDLDISVLIAADDVGRKVSENQSAAVRRLCNQIQKSFTCLRNLFSERYAENVEVVDPQLRNNPELVQLVARFERDWCLGKTHIVPKENRDQLISFSQLIEGTTEKYEQFKEQVDCSDAEIFLTIPYLLVLKSSLDSDQEAMIASSLCKRFFPALFRDPLADRPEEDGKPVDYATKVQEAQAYQKFMKLKEDFATLRESAGKDFFDIYSRIERELLLGSATPASLNPSQKNTKLTGEASQKKWKLLESQTQAIKEIGMCLTRFSPQQWNEFMVVALGVPEDEPLPERDPSPQPQAQAQPAQQQQQPSTDQTQSAA